MQIVEVSMIGVRASVLRLTRRDSPLRFEVFSMVHIADPAFYTAVTERLRRCDLLLVEGVGRPDASGSTRMSRSAALGGAAMTASYRLPARFQRSGLIEDPIRYDELGVPVRYPDMTGRQFTEGWRAVPAWQRTMMVAMAPLAGLDRLARGSRRSLARHLELTDQDWHDRVRGVSSLQDLENLLGDQRDQLLIAAMDEIHRTRRQEPITVAVVYGAAHVAPIVQGMRALHRYSVRSAEWLTVFDL